VTRELECGRVRLTFRDAVAARRIPVIDGQLWYLSLFEKEIDERVDRLERMLSAATPTLAPTIETLADGLELTDTLLAQAGDGTLFVARGGCSNFPLYRSTQSATLRLSTHLPLAQMPCLSRTGLVASLSAALLGGTYAPNASLATPVSGWLRLRRGFVTTLQPDGEATRERPIEIAPLTHDGDADPAFLETSLRAAFDDFTALQARVRRSILELSGGIDSTLAGATALGKGQQMLGLSVEFPYYEFRFEREAQQAVARCLQIERRALDGTSLFPYAPVAESSRFDEPTLFTTGVAHAAAVARQAAEHGAEVIYMGHGGDSVFCNNLDLPEDVPGRVERDAFTSDGWQRLGQVLGPLQGELWRRRTSGCFVQDAQQDVWVREAFGVTVRTPFTDRAVFRCGRSWSRACAVAGQKPDKTILMRAFADLLPAAVSGRRGKVPYDGVWQRAYARHGDHIAGTLDCSASLLREVGLSPRWLVNRVRTLAAGNPLSGRDVMAAYVLATWLQSWDYARLNDVRWAD
jgi:asparagine synthetase B (glutamine-hydrolysing)